MDCAHNLLTDDIAYDTLPDVLRLLLTILRWFFQSSTSSVE